MSIVNRMLWAVFFPHRPVVFANLPQESDDEKSDQDLVVDDENQVSRFDMSPMLRYLISWSDIFETTKQVDSSWNKYKFRCVNSSDLLAGSHILALFRF